ncbi:bifunctional diguanylate cyclase/phosphodiesterase [Luteibacter yeojuensis]
MSLGTLVLVTVIPMLLMGVIAIALAGREFRESSRERLRETAQALSHAVDDGIRDNIASLRLLANVGGNGLTSEQATALLRSSNGIGDDTRVLVLNSEKEGAGVLPPDLYARTLAESQAHISNLILIEGSALPRVAITLPMATSGFPSRVMALVQPSNQLINVIQRSHATGSELLVAVVDSTGHIAARSRSPEAYLGKPVPDWNKLLALGTNEGLFSARTKEGGTVIFAFRKLDNAPGWALVVGQPIDSFDAGWKVPLWWMIGAWFVATLAAFAIAHRFAQRILVPMQSLVARSRRVVDDVGHVGELPSSSIREIRELQESLLLAEQTLEQRAQDAQRLAEQLRSSEKRYRSIAEAGALVLWRCNIERTLTAINGWRELTGQSDDAAVGKGWMQRIHPADLSAMEDAWDRSVSLEVSLDIEFRVVGADGGWRWVRCRGARVEGEDPVEWVGVLEDADARRKAQARIAYLAHHDALTGLANRSLFHDRLQIAVTDAHRGRRSALLCVDLDRFKDVNDTLGHPTGDALLIAVTGRLKGILRETDLVARLGGDEFAILLGSERQPDDASSIAGRIIDAIKEPYELDGHSIVIGASIGVVVIDDLAPGTDRLLQNADLALYRAKGEGKGRYCFFEADMDVRMQLRRQLELDLRAALSRGEFVVHYQPMIEVQSGKLSGFEALLRWEHPSRGLLMPMDFFDLAEEIGLLIPLGRWILEQACRDACSWPERLRVAVNVSASQLAHPRLHEMVENALAASQLAPTRLELEITENALLANIEAASATLLKLKVSGVAIVMDDFGTGYSSLGYLRAFPFDKVKIDKSFVRNLGPSAEGNVLISAISQLCARLGIGTTVEGIETAVQLAHIKEEACTEAQGYLFGEALPADGLAAFIRAHETTWPPRGDAPGA